MRVGLDLGLTTIDAVALPIAAARALAAATVDDHAGRVTPGVRCAPVPRNGGAPGDVLDHAAAALALDPGAVVSIAVTGGRSRELPDDWHGVPVVKVAEPEAIGRGGLAIARVRRALVVSCGTGTAMVAADRDLGSYRHVTGTSVGGGTLLGLSQALLGTADVGAFAALAARGRAAGVDVTLGEALGAGIGHLPPDAIAVSLGKLRAPGFEPDPADLAAGLTVMVGQVIALLALAAAQGHGLTRIVAVGRLAEVAPVARVFDAVADLYGQPHFVVPALAAHATALGAVLAADAGAPTAAAPRLAPA